MSERTRTIRIHRMARVEGSGSLTLRMKGTKATAVELNIFEPPRFFEAFLRGRSLLDVPDITARICGICPVAYQMSSCHALEDVLGVRVEDGLRTLRRLLYCGEWIESHSLHVFMLHAPDFLGYADAITMAKDHPEAVKRGLRIKKTGNAILTRLGGREIHPVNVRVGGLYRVPTKDELCTLLPEIEWSLGAVSDSLTWAAGFSFPDFERDYEFVALRHDGEYPITEGRIVSNKGLDVALRDFETHCEEEQVPYSTALHARLRGRGAYLCGSLARFNLNFDRLSDVAREAALSAGLRVPCTNPFKSILVRLVEILQALEEAKRIIESYVRPGRPFVEIQPRAGTGYGATEAPRGLLFHRYTLDERGAVAAARIIPPTSQNQKTIEEDLFSMAGALAELPVDEATLRAEQAVRNHDPCISCATHFLDCRIERE